MKYRVCCPLRGRGVAVIVGVADADKVGRAVLVAVIEGLAVESAVSVGSETGLHPQIRLTANNSSKMERWCAVFIRLFSLMNNPFYPN